MSRSDLKIQMWSVGAAKIACPCRIDTAAVKREVGPARAHAELQLGSVQLRVEAEVRNAYSRYQPSVQRLQLYRGGMQKDADRVLEARLYAYQRGGATLLEVIDAERTSADVYLPYAQALVEHAHALVALEQAAGTWDVSF
jgi:outer membrane protein TolC